MPFDNELVIITLNKKEQKELFQYIISRKGEPFSGMKINVDKKTDVVLGVHMVGEDAPEIVQGLAVALNCGVTKAQFNSTIGIHPTAAEEFVTMRDPLPDSSSDRENI